MAKKESNKPLPDQDSSFDAAPAKPSFGAFTNRLLDVVKLLIGLSMVPFVYGVTISFWQELSTIALRMREAFGWGMVSFIAVYLFVWEPARLYAAGHKLLEAAFGFVKPLVKVAPYAVPIYTLVIFVGFWVVSFFTDSWTRTCVFLLGFSMMLHLAFSAKAIRGKKGDLLKSNYIFGFSLVYIICIALTAGCLNAMFERYSIVRFVVVGYQLAAGIFQAVFRQLFAV
jgi:hypothetical protein